MIDMPPIPEIEPIVEEKPLTKDEIALEKYELKYPPELRKVLCDATTQLEIQQKTIRQRNIMEWKQLDFYWQGLQNIFWSDAAKDWRPYEEGIGEDSGISANDIGRIINVYRSYGESIIASLSATLPGVRFAPDNADNPDDISTAKAYGKIANLISVHNDATTLLVKALFTLFNQSFVASYNYYQVAPEFGTVKVPKEIEEEILVTHEVCPTCGSNLDEAMDVEGFKLCEICRTPVIPMSESAVEKQLIKTYVDTPKGREIIEVYGPLNVQIPFYATDLKNSPYLILETEHHISLAKALFPHLKDKITPEDSYSSYERWARQPSEAFDTAALDLVTFRRVWLRPSGYYIIADDDLRRGLQESYPTGVYFLLLNDLFAEAYEENVDDHWTVSKSPTSLYLHAAPMGRSLKDVQDMTNDMYNLTLRTILYGIPMTFAESNAIDWDKFGESPSEPGMVYPAKVAPGQNLAGMFHTVKTASLSREVDSFGDRLSAAGQFVSGANAAIYGGELQGGSDTAKEYETRKNQALQRLSLPWKMINVWWKDTLLKASKEYARNLQVDESYAKKTGDSYINVWIRKAEMQGKVGEVEAESSDQFPVSEQDRRALILNLLTSPSPTISQFFGQVVAHPENIGLVSRLLGFGQLYIPGDDQRNKQLVESLNLMVSEPVPTGQIQMDELGQPILDQNGQPQPILMPSVPIEEIDDDTIHIEVTKAFMVSDPGQYLKETNPAGYQNLMLHLQMHQQRQAMIAQQQMQQQMELENGGSERGGNSGSGSGDGAGAK